MCSWLSLGDLFVVGLTLDFLGAVLLGRSLWARMFYGIGITSDSIDPAEALEKGHQEVDGRTGSAFLALGFLVQAVAYVAIIDGHDIEIGGRRAVGAATLALAALIVGAGTRWVIGWPLLRQRLIHHSRWRWHGRSYDNPADVQMLTVAADSLGKPWRGEETRAEYVARVFGLRDVVDPRGMDATNSRLWIEALRRGDDRAADDIDNAHGKRPWLTGS